MNLILSATRASADKFPGGFGATEKIPKNSKKDQKIALLSLFQGTNGKKRPKNNKKDRKIALLSLYILYLYHG